MYLLCFIIVGKWLCECETNKQKTQDMFFKFLLNNLEYNSIHSLKNYFKEKHTLKINFKEKKHTLKINFKEKHRVKNNSRKNT